MFSIVVVLGVFGIDGGSKTFSQAGGALTPAQAEIEKQRLRLTSPESEERRDALMRLWAMHSPAASRVALSALTDASPMVRAVAAKAIVSLGSEESARNLIPLLSDRDEFVRREVVYVLGSIRSRSATSAISELLVTDKEDGVRSAAAVALGQIADEGAVVTLSQVLSGQPPTAAKGKGKRKGESNPFVLRSSARALGQIKSRAGVPALIAALANEKLPDDVRREAARALGLIGDPGAADALRAASNSRDPYLSQAAFESLRKVSP